MTTATTPDTGQQHRLAFSTKEDLVRGFTNALLFAGRDGTMPMLTTVRLEYADHQLRLVATDRYRLSVEDMATKKPDANDAPADPPAPFQILLQTSDVKSMLAVLKGVHRADPIEFVYDADADRVRVTGGYTGGSSEYRVDTDHNFPAYRSLIPDVADTVGVDEMRFNPAFLADLAKVKVDGKLGAVRIRLFGSGKVTRVDYQDGLTVLLMSMRMGADNSTSADEWGAGD